MIFESFKGLELQLSGVFRMNLHYSYTCLALPAECTSGNVKNFLQLQFYNLIVFKSKV